MLACTATNKAIDSLVAKLEAAGLTEIVVRLAPACPRGATQLLTCPQAALPLLACLL